MMTLMRSPVEGRANWLAEASAGLMLNINVGLLLDVPIRRAVASGAGGSEPGSLVPMLVTQQRPPPLTNQPLTAKGK